MRVLFKYLGFMGLVAMATPALAVDINITGFDPGSGPLTIDATGNSSLMGFPVNYTTSVGRLRGTYDSASFLTYCAEITQSITFGFNYIDYSLTTWSEPVRTNLSKLISYALATGQPGNPTESAVMQAAVWEVLYETSTFKLGTGDTGFFKVTSTDAAVQSGLNGFNWAAVAAQPITHTVAKLAGPIGQDLLLVTAVPETSTYLMMLSGIAVVGWAARRQARRV